MSLNYHYAAHTYVDNWVVYDRKARKVLGFRIGYQPEPEQAREQLIEVARIYGIARNFRLELEGDNARLSPVWEALKEINEPTSDEDAKECVNKLVELLKQTYKSELLSAASKFLWMRFGRPFIIYDSLTSKWIDHIDHIECLSTRPYDNFYDAWRKKFEENQKKIIAACEELLNANVTKFLCPTEAEEKEFEEAIKSPWFAERVFDFAIVNDESQRRN
jgi:hypothetical protein